MNYLDFDLEIGPGTGQEYPVAVLRSPVGEARATMHFPFDEAALDLALTGIQLALLRSGGRRQLSVTREGQAVQDFGRELFHALFVGDVRTMYYMSRRTADQSGRGLRLRLRIASPELAALPWEFLYDFQIGQYLCLSVSTPIVRYLELPHPVMPLVVEPPLNILGMVASPANLPTLDLEQERLREEAALETLRTQGLVKLTWLAGQTWRDLQRAMRQGPWHIFHFVGHGGFDSSADDGVVVLADEDGRARPLGATQLGRLLADHQPLRLVVLNACEGARAGSRDIFSSTASTLVRRGVPAVMAMQYEITDRAAVELSRSFYEALTDGLPVDAAVAEARKAVSLAVSNTLEWGTPVLYTRTQDGNIFDLRTSVPAVSANILDDVLRRTEIEPAQQATRDEQLERTTRLFEQCDTVKAIAHLRVLLGEKELAEPESAVLRSFTRISQDVEAALQQSSSYNQRLVFGVIEDQLDRLFRELYYSSLPNAKRFCPIAADWRRVVGTHTHELAQNAELLQEIDNPYVVAVPLTEHQKVFVGRGDIAARIENLLLDRRRPPLLLYGQRRVGKTSLLTNLGRLVRSNILPMFVDLQGPASSSNNEAGFLYNVAKQMKESAEKQRGVLIPLLTREALLSDPFISFDEWLDEVEHSMPQEWALLAFDEFEALDRAFAGGRLSEERVLGMLRHMIQHRPRLKILLAGSHTFEEFQRWSSFLINVQLLHISYLKQSEALQLVEEPVNNFPLRYRPDASKRVLSLTRGHPFLVQLLCSEIVSLKNEQPVNVRRLAIVSDVEAAASIAMTQGSFFFADIQRNQLDAKSRELLTFIARQGEGAVVSKPELAQQIAEELDHALDLLNRRELIERINGGYRVQVELIRRWFAQGVL